MSAVYEIKIKKYNELVKFSRANFPRERAKMPFWDACIYLLLWVGDQDRDRAVFQHVRRRGGGEYEFLVEGNPRKIGSQTMTKCIDHLEKLGLVAITRGFYLRDKGVWERGKTVVDVARLKKMLGGLLVEGHEPALGVWKPRIKVDGISYGSYREFWCQHGKKKFVAEVWKRVRGLKTVYDGIRVSFPRDPSEMPPEMLQTVWDKYLEAQDEKPAGKAIYEPERGIRDIWDRASEWENTLRNGGVLSGAIREGGLGRVYSKMSGIPRFLVPMIKIGGEFTYECDCRSCVPQLLLQKAGQWQPGNDLYEALRLNLQGKGYFLDRDQVKAMMLFALNARDKTHFVRAIFGRAKNPTDFCRNWSDAHRAASDGVFVQTVNTLFPGLASAIYNRKEQLGVIRIESEIFLDTAIEIFRRTGKRPIYRFDSLVVPASVDPKDVQALMDRKLTGILGRESHLNLKVSKVFSLDA